MVKGRRNRNNAMMPISSSEPCDDETASPKRKEIKVVYMAEQNDGESNCTNNIFLQEPVLSLNFDKTPNASSRVTIKNSFLTKDLHYKFNPTADDEKTFVLQYKSDEAYNCDGNTSISNISSPSSLTNKKPLTPHRILCNSSIKAEITVKPVKPVALTYVIADKKRTRKYNTRKRLHNKEPENMTNQLLKKESGSEHTETIKPVLNSSTNPSAKQNSKNNKTLTETKLTDFFPVRRSVRKTKKEVIDEMARDIEKAIEEQREEGLTVKEFEGKGRGVVTHRSFTKGEFVVEYIGDLITVAEAKERENIYALDENSGCYMYYFKHQNIQHCIDATAETGKLGRLVNHSRNGNLLTKTVFYNRRPHLVLLAKENIDAGVEVMYDYGDRSKEALQYHPWLAF